MEFLLLAIICLCLYVFYAVMHAAANKAYRSILTWRHGSTNAWKAAVHLCNKIDAEQNFDEDAKELLQQALGVEVRNRFTRWRRSYEAESVAASEALLVASMRYRIDSFRKYPDTKFQKKVDCFYALEWLKKQSPTDG